ncbi:hypothetical protein [Methanobacterium sp.]|uniref:hypothetical protein n=1 Tax=Methanobacterium sp. TaxID=2164 RepID=UPI003C757ECA
MCFDGSPRENAMVILKAMVGGSRKRESGDAIKMMTHLRCDEINEGIECLEKMHMVRTMPSCNKFRYNFLNVIWNQKAAGTIMSTLER